MSDEVKPSKLCVRKADDFFWLMRWSFENKYKKVTLTLLQFTGASPP